MPLAVPLEVNADSERVVEECGDIHPCRELLLVREVLHAACDGTWISERHLEMLAGLLLERVGIGVSYILLCACGGASSSQSRRFRPAARAQSGTPPSVLATDASVSLPIRETPDWTGRYGVRWGGSSDEPSWPSTRGVRAGRSSSPGEGEWKAVETLSFTTPRGQGGMNSAPKRSAGGGRWRWI